MKTEHAEVLRRPVGPCSAACGEFTTSNASSPSSSWGPPSRTRYTTACGYSFLLSLLHRKSRIHGLKHFNLVQRCAAAWPTLHARVQNHCILATASVLLFECLLCSTRSNKHCGTVHDAAHQRERHSLALHPFSCNTGIEHTFGGKIVL